MQFPGIKWQARVADGKSRLGLWPLHSAHTQEYRWLELSFWGDGRKLFLGYRYLSELTLSVMGMCELYLISTGLFLKHVFFQVGQVNF